LKFQGDFQLVESVDSTIQLSPAGLAGDQSVIQGTFAANGTSAATSKAGEEAPLRSKHGITGTTWHNTTCHYLCEMVGSFESLTVQMTRFTADMLLVAGSKWP